MSFHARFELPPLDEDIDLSNCDGCRYANGDCWKANRCLMED